MNDKIKCKIIYADHKGSHVNNNNFNQITLQSRIYIRDYCYRIKNCTWETYN